MENDYIDDGISRRVKPGAKLLMALVAVITVIAVWLVPVGEEEAPPSLPSLPSASEKTEPLPLPDVPSAAGTSTPASAADSSGLPPASPGSDSTAVAEPSTGSGTSESLALPPPPGGIATVTGGGEGARAFLYELRTEGAQPDPEVVFAEAERMQTRGDLENAYLLYRYAARHGQVQAAMALGASADPAYHSKASSYLPEPAPGQAYKWYSKAAAAGDKEASQRLQDLRGRVERDAAAGDKQAQRLLLQWQ